ncbi:hypothetical protein EVAR_55799_1 [Eumeta japonica]|uniref:Uncharacterized protein n=1 Tax=Eumeta variegata TaxID=151549 RepID=A0A4C1YQ09_EUMVA|nr:hypothetical protein EVAR_55799_1 [Eumeta japonica]
MRKRRADQTRQPLRVAIRRAVDRRALRGDRVVPLPAPLSALRSERRVGCGVTSVVRDAKLKAQLYV